MQPIQRKVLIHRVEIQRPFSIIFITEVYRAKKLEKSQNLKHLAFFSNCMKYRSVIFIFSFYKGGLKISIKKRWEKMTSQEAKILWEYSSYITSQHIEQAKSYCKMSGNRCTLTSIGTVLIQRARSFFYIVLFRSSNYCDINSSRS